MKMAFNVRYLNFERIYGLDFREKKNLHILIAKFWNVLEVFGQLAVACNNALDFRINFKNEDLKSLRKVYTNRMNWETKFVFL